LSNCAHEHWKTTHWDKVLCHQEEIDKYKHQVVCEQRCEGCSITRRAWYGIGHNDRENKARMHVIKPKKYAYWDRYIKVYGLISSDGQLAVKVQKNWDGVALKYITLQKVQF
jgi:hypothetical protein